MKIRVSKILTIVYSLYIFSFVTISCSQLDQISIFSNIHAFIQRACILILFVFMFKNIFHKRILFGSSIIIIVLSLVYYSNNGVLDLITIFAFSFSMRKIPFNKIVLLDIKVKIIACILIVGLALLGIIDSQISFSARGVLRNSLGFSHANILSLIMLSVCLEWIYLRFYMIKWYEYLLLILIIYGLYFTTNSLTSIIGLSFMLVCNLLWRCVNKFKIGYKPLSLTFILILPTVFTLSLYLATHYSASSQTMVTLNEMATGRIQSMNSFYNQYGISLFGKPIVLISTTQAAQYGISPQVLDNGYMRLLLRFGLVITIILLGILIKLNYNMLKIKNFAIVSCLGTYFIIGVMESSFYRIEYNIFLLTIAYVLMNNYNSIGVTSASYNKRIIT